MRIPTTRELGLPEKFERWRPVQEEGVTTLSRYHAVKRHKALCSPTGSGKSGTFVGHAVISREPTAIVTLTKGLQDQYARDFKDMGMVDLRGRDNYPCTYKDDYTCEQGYAANCPYRGTGMCPSDAQRMKAALSSLVVMNYKMWTSNRKFGLGLDHFTQVIFDEAHAIPEALADAMQVKLQPHEIEEDLGVDFPAKPLDMRVWRPWAIEAKAIADKRFNDLRLKLQDTAQPRPSWVREFIHFKNLVRRLGVIITASPDNWVVDTLSGDESGYVFDPIWPGRYAESCMFFKVPHIVYGSATMRRKTLHISGIGIGSYEKLTHDRQGYETMAETENYVFQEFDSDFDPADCPTYFIPAQYVDNKHPDNTILFLRMDQYIGTRLDRKGIIHTISHDRRAELVARSMWREFMIYNQRGEVTSAKIEEFLEAPPPRLLVSPSISTGYDFPGAACEYSITAKIPFDPPSRISSARRENDPEYAPYKALQAMIQMDGRHKRYRGDRGESAIFDMNMRWFWPKFRYLAPRSYRSTYKEVTIIPPPLPKL